MKWFGACAIEHVLALITVNCAGSYLWFACQNSASWLIPLRLLYLSFIPPGASPDAPQTWLGGKLNSCKLGWYDILSHCFIEIAGECTALLSTQVIKPDSWIFGYFWDILGLEHIGPSCFGFWRCFTLRRWRWDGLEAVGLAMRKLEPLVWFHDPLFFSLDLDLMHKTPMS